MRVRERCTGSSDGGHCELICIVVIECSVVVKLLIDVIVRIGLSGRWGVGSMSEGQSYIRIHGLLDDHGRGLLIAEPTHDCDE